MSRPSHSWTELRTVDDFPRSGRDQGLAQARQHIQYGLFLLGGQSFKLIVVNGPARLRPGEKNFAAIHRIQHLRNWRISRLNLRYRCTDRCAREQVSLAVVDRAPDVCHCSNGKAGERVVVEAGYINLLNELQGY